MARTIALLIAAACVAGCNGEELPTSPRPTPVSQPSATPLAIAGVEPKDGWPFYYTEIQGTGFKPGVRVTYGGVDAAVVWFNRGILVANPPWQEPGPVDVTVTNPDGTTVTVAAGFAYKAATIELSQSDVRAGELVTVTWSGPHDPSDFSPPDVIGVYAVGDTSNTALWSRPSPSATPGNHRFSAQFAAPLRPGHYEVRYHMLSQHLLAKAALVTR